MTAAAKALAKKILALTEKDRVQLAIQLLDSLSFPEEKISRKTGNALAEPKVEYGRSKDTEELTQEEWDESWKAEIEKRIAEIESGKVKCIPYAEARKQWDKILGKS